MYIVCARARTCVHTACARARSGRTHVHRVATRRHTQTHHVCTRCTARCNACSCGCTSCTVGGSHGELDCHVDARMYKQGVPMHRVGARPVTRVRSRCAARCSSHQHNAAHAVLTGFALKTCATGGDSGGAGAATVAPSSAQGEHRGARSAQRTCKCTLLGPTSAVWRRTPPEKAQPGASGRRSGAISVAKGGSRCWIQAIYPLSSSISQVNGGFGRGKASFDVPGALKGRLGNPNGGKKRFGMAKRGGEGLSTPQSCSE